MRSLATALAALILALLTLNPNPASAAAKEQTFVLQEHFGYGWPADFVHREIDLPSPGGIMPKQAELLIEGQPAPFQFEQLTTHPDGSIRHASVIFRTDLPAKAKKTVVLRAAEKPATPAAEGELKVSRQGNTVELSNGVTSVRLPLGEWKSPEGDAGIAKTAAALTAHLALPPGDAASAAVNAETLPGPLLGVKLPSGKWIAASRLKPHDTFTFNPPLPQDLKDVPAGRLLGFESQVLSEGPLVARVRVVYRFEKEGSYTAEVSLRRGEPLVRVDERYEKAGAMVIPFGAGFRPTKAIYDSFKPTPTGRTLPISYDKPAEIGMFVGWNCFFERIAPATLFVGDPAGDQVGLVSTESDWLPFPYNQGLYLSTIAGSGGAKDAQVIARASLASGHRHWAIYTGKADAFLEGPKQQAEFYHWWTQRLMITLDKVSSWQIEWPGMDQIAFPHTFFDNKELPEIRKALQAEPTVQTLMEGKGATPLGSVRMTDLAARYLVSGDAALLPKIKAANEGLDYFDRFVKLYHEASGMFTDDQVGGMAVSDELLKRCVAVEFLLGSDQLTPAEKHELLKKMAFIVYVLHDSFWMPPNHPFEPQKEAPYPAYVQGTPNQKHCYISARGLAESALTGHPMLPRWTAHTLEEYQRCLPGSVAPSGVHAESPFYSSRDTMRFGPFWRALTRAGVKGPVVDHWMARLAHTFDYMGDMTTPPDPRLGGVRAYHPIGRSSTGVIDPTFIIGADPWARNDPALASKMRWLWEQQGKPSPYIMDTTGGRNISLTLLSSVSMLRAKLPAAPPLVSRRWDGFGAIFRSQVASGFESNVLFRHDPFCWDLYEGNNGGVYLFAKGAPLLPRFGAYWTQPNLMSVPFGNRVNFASGDEKIKDWNNALGHTTDFAALGDVADFASGITETRDWTRSVLFAKDLDREDPVYLLVRDKVARAGSASALHWWVMSKAVQPEGITKPGVIPTRQDEKQWLANIGKNWKEAPRLTGQLQRFEGQFGVDLDMFIAAPEKPVIVTDAMGVGPNLAYCVNKDLYEYQQLVRIEQPAMKGYLTLLAPRAGGAASPKYRTIADGNGVAIERADGGEDHLFLADEVIKESDSGVKINARAGFARVSKTKPLRLAVVGGNIKAEGVTLTCPSAAALTASEQAIQVVTTGDPKLVTLDLPGRLKKAAVTIVKSDGFTAPR